MDPKGQSLLKLLFNEGESICVSNNKFAYHSIPLNNAFSGNINLYYEDKPIKSCESSNLILCAMNPINGIRNDQNVTAFRSFLIEIDFGSIPDQVATIAHTKMPFSAQIFSGSKSVHTVITLDEDLPDRKAYDFVAEWLFKIMTMADKNCANPSRSVRIPGAYRAEGKQRLIKLRKRISHAELFKWLNQYEHLRPVPKVRKVVPEGEADYSRLSPWARAMLTKGVMFKNGRNRAWFGLAIDFAIAGFSEEQTIKVLIEYFEEERDFKEKEFLSAISQGFKQVNEGKLK